MPDNPEFGRRLWDARREFALRHDREPTFEEIGRAVGELLGRPAYSHQGVRKWFTQGAEPAEFAVVQALARILEVTPAYLAFGDPVQVRGAADTHGFPVERVDRPLDSRDGPPSAAARRRPKAG